MKTFTLPLAFLAMISCSTLRNTSEVNDQYKPLKKFKLEKGAEIGSDTADYLTYNFVTNKDKYIGKPFNDLLKDLKINIVVIYFTPIYFDRAYCDNIQMNLYNPAIVRNGVEYNLNIIFKEKFNYGELDIIQRNDQNAWSESQYNYLKNKIIKDIVIGDSRNWNRNKQP